MSPVKMRLIKKLFPKTTSWIMREGFSQGKAAGRQYQYQDMQKALDNVQIEKFANEELKLGFVFAKETIRKA